MSDVLHQALNGLEQALVAHGAHEAVVSSVQEVRDETNNHHTPNELTNKRQQDELRQRLKRDVILEVRSLFTTYPSLESLCATLASVPLTKAVFDTKCDLLYRLAEAHPHIRSIFAHYNDLRSALKRRLYTVNPGETDWSEFQHP
jgi:hypothetical protein